MNEGSKYNIFKKFKRFKIKPKLFNSVTDV